MANRLQINPAKTEVLWCSSARRQHQIPSNPVRVGNTSVLPVSVVRDLGVYLDADLSMRAHITATVRTCFAVLRQIRSVRRSLTPDAVLTLLDFCCSTLAGVSGTLLQRLQSVLNAVARLVYSARRSEHTTPVLRQLHWLIVPERIKFRLCVLVYRCLHNKAPPYLAETLHLITEVDARRRLRSASSSTLIVPSPRRSTISDRAFPVAAACAWSATQRQDCLVFECVSGRPQNSTVQGIV